MPQACSICTHPEKEAIEIAIIAGTPLSHVAPKYNTSERTLRRHRDNCFKSALQAELEVRRNPAQPGATAQPDTPSEQDGQPVFDALAAMDWMRKETRNIYKEVRETKDYRFALQALAELRRQNELCAKLVGELDEHSITITAIPEWRELRALLLDALSHHPQAKMAVIRALEAYDHDAIA